MRLLPVRLIEFHVAHDCNLTCEGCSHFSPTAARQNVTAENLASDLDASSTVLDPEYVHILGGEPLLNRSLSELIPLFRRFFPGAKIKLVTNGVLLLKAPSHLYESLRVNGVGVAVSVYPAVSLDIPAIQRRCEEYRVFLECWRQDTFLDFFDPNGGHDPAVSRAHCPMEDALNVRDGRVFPCPVTAWADLGGFPFFAADGVRLSAGVDEIRTVLSGDRITSLCGYCRPESQRKPHRLVPRGSNRRRRLYQVAAMGPTEGQDHIKAPGEAR